MRSARWATSTMSDGRRTAIMLMASSTCHSLGRRKRSGLARLDASAAVRYERYPGIDAVAVPKFGLIYAPVHGLDVKVSWGKSFRAPTLLQQYQVQSALLYPVTSVGGAGYPATATALYVTGGNPALTPAPAHGPLGSMFIPSRSTVSASRRSISRPATQPALLPRSRSWRPRSATPTTPLALHSARVGGRERANCRRRAILQRVRASVQPGRRRCDHRQYQR
ncbi:TonB-dependent receptor [Hankyongella ginsenosidimutans]|uniref:TonB-dependent receptor n=1 Tax=Hankyongella ginsenosidimutans TaxID=1763828 RepID=A0A4D7CBM4_9SPHN|nr:TonB-dependent receptor [Hankyongella ginsenosidimutans]